MGHGNLAHIGASQIDPLHPVAQFEVLWRSLAGERDVPNWDAFDPIACPKLLRWVLLLRPDDDGRLFYSISGAGCDEVFGIRYQGKYFGDGLPEDAYRARVREFTEAVEQRRSLFSRVNLPLKNKEFIEVYRGVFPFLDETGELERIVAVIAPTEVLLA